MISGIEDYMQLALWVSEDTAIVKEMSDDEAIIKMVDANIQREEILPSEEHGL